MKTKMMSIFLAFCMLVSLLVPVSAAESTSANSASEQETYEDQFIDNSTYVVDADELPHTPYNPLPIKEENPARTNSNSTTVIIHDNPEDSLSTIAPQAVYGPYTTLETMADQKMQVVVAGLKNAGVLSVVKYAGYECYKFSNGGNTVYVTRDAFYKQQKATPTRSISDDATTAINSRDTSKKYTTIIRSSPYTYNGNKVYHWSFARIGINVFHAKNDSELAMSAEITQAYDFDVYPYSIQDTSKATLKVQPTMAIRIASCGSGNARCYFDSYEFRGLGENTSTSALGKVVKVAFYGSKLAGDIVAGSLTIGTLYSVCNDVVNLSKATSSSRTSYLTNLLPLSSSSHYLYKFETPVPYPLRLTNDYSTMELGITGTITSSLKYAVYYGWTVS